MCVCVVFVSVVFVLGVWFFGGEFFELFFIVMVQTRFVVVDKDAGCDVHCVTENQSLAHSAFCEAVFYEWGYVDEFASFFDVKP